MHELTTVMSCEKKHLCLSKFAVCAQEGSKEEGF